MTDLRRIWRTEAFRAGLYTLLLVWIDT
jgi:hypothetical protein